MNNTDLNGRLIQEAQMIMEEARRAFDNEAWNLVVRRSQEVVELSLKGLLKLMGVESPKTHDVSDTFAKICREKKIAIESEKLAEMQRISHQLAEIALRRFIWRKNIRKNKLAKLCSLPVRS